MARPMFKDCDACKNQGVKNVGCPGCRRKRPYFPETATTEDRFWAKVKKAPGDLCWEWQGHRRHAGHGQFALPGVVRLDAHRYAWELVHGPIPAGMFICHKCDNPPCVRVDHLYLGVSRDNMHDMIRKGRKANATKPALVLRARAMLKAGASVRAVSAALGLAWWRVSYINREGTWAALG